MSKRRINKQQSIRIEKIQQNYQSNEQENTANGLVLTRYNKQVAVEDETGKLIHCSTRPNLNHLVAGDRVIWKSEGIDQGVVVSQYPRSSVLEKATYSGLKPIAANITQLIIVIAPKPEISWSLLDSYLVLAETLHLRAIILLNKIDLDSDALKKELLTSYKSLPYSIIFFTQENPDYLLPLQHILDQQVSVFVGQSGVGKSSIIRKILPHEVDILTGPLSEISELGKHTTSNSRYYHLLSGGALIDSPGVREFNLDTMDTMKIADAYPEFRPHLSQCKYRNCSHQNTPHCAIIQAVKDNKISRRRYENFLKLCEQFSKNGK